MLTIDTTTRSRQMAHAIVLLAALMLLCAASARGESPWNKLTRALTGQQEQQTATATPPSLAPTAPGLPMIPEENAQGTTGTIHANQPPAEMTGLAVSDSRGADARLDLGKESDDTNLTAVDLFHKPDMRRLLGDEPRFVYAPKDRPDPMLVPWVRNAAIFSEMNTAAELALKAGAIEQAIANYQRILALNDPRYTALVQGKLQEINNAKAAEAAKAANVGVVVANIELPSWVTENTTGVIDGGGENMALIGDDLVKVGQSIPRYPEIKVAQISGKKVVYQIQDKTFEIELKPLEK
jgi:hypothetical protein